MTLHAIDKKLADTMGLTFTVALKKHKDIGDRFKKLQVKNNVLSNSDGAELRQVDINLEDGYYELVSSNKNGVVLNNGMPLTEFGYPDVDPIFDISSHIEIPFDIEHNLDLRIKAVVATMPNDCSVDIERYLEIAKQEWDSIYVHPDEAQPIVFIKPGVRVALMPCKC